MSKYKCESHKLDFCCLGCVRAYIARHDALLKFVKSISDNFCFNQTDDDGLKFLVDKEQEAHKLLEEMGV